MKIITRTRFFLRPGEVLQFNKKSIHDYLISSWSHIEKTGTWTNNKTARMAFKLKDYNPKKRFFLEIRLVAFIAGKKKQQEAEVSINGNPIGTIKIDSDGIHTVQLGFGNEFLKEKNFLQFQFLNKLVSPKELGISVDQRKLGFHFIKMQLKYY